MAKRLLLVTLPEGDTIADVAEAVQVVADLGAESGRRTVELLLEGDEVEATLDALEERWGTTEGFRAVLLAPEAVLPRPPKEPELKAADPEKEAEGGERISRDELYADVTEGLGVSWIFLGLTLLSSVVAAVGLLRDDLAVIIGAMVVAPLLRPNVAMALGATLGDLALVGRAARASLVGVVASLGLAFSVGWFAAVDPEMPAIAARSVLGLGDFALALAAGAAGTLAFTRGLAGAVIGVMVAVALLPPIVAAGLLAGAGHWAPASAAFLLAVANGIGINLAAIFTFLLTGVRPAGFFEAEQAKRSTWIAIALWGALLLALLATVRLAEGN